MGREAVMVQSDPRYSQGMDIDQAELEHLKAKTELLKAQAESLRGSPLMSERALTTHQLLSRLNDVNQELVRRVQEGLI